MRIFSRLRNFKELRRLKRAAVRSPSPGTIGALAERYIALGRTDDAFRIARSGMSLFPTSERLAAVSTFAKRQKLQAQITKLRREMAERPVPTVYSQLAEIYRELGNHEQALEICDQCLQRYPLNENPYLIIGEVRLERFLEDLITHDGVEAEKQLRRVVKLNSHNLKAHLLLAQIYFVIGAVDPMQEHLRTVLALSPDSPEIVNFMSEVAARPIEKREPLDPDDDDFDDEEDLTVSELIRSVEVSGAMRNQPEDFPASHHLAALGSRHRTQVDVERLKESLVDIGRTRGVVNAVILDRDGEPVADVTDPESLTRKQFSDLVKEILTTSEETSRRMDVGSFHWCTVEGAFGGVTIGKVKNLAVGLKYEHAVKSERAQRLLEEFTARSLTMSSGEVARA